MSVQCPTEIQKPTKARKGNLLYESNPFLPDVNSSSRSKKKINKRGDMMMASAETGEVVANVAGFWHIEEVDSTKFVKLYVNGVKAFKELSGAGTKVFEVLYLKMQDAIGKDMVYMSFTTVDQSITPMSEATYTRGMRELVDKQFLAATPHLGLFWLNPDYVFNGDRLSMVKEYRLKSSDSRKRNRDTLTGDIFQASGIALPE